MVPMNVPKFHVKMNEPGEIYGCDITEIKGNHHLVVVTKVCAYSKEDCQM